MPIVWDAQLGKYVAKSRIVHTQPKDAPPPEEPENDAAAPDSPDQTADELFDDSFPSGGASSSIDQAAMEKVNKLAAEHRRRASVAEARVANLEEQLTAAQSSAGSTETSLQQMLDNTTEELANNALELEQRTVDISRLRDELQKVRTTLEAVQAKAVDDAKEADRMRRQSTSYLNEREQCFRVQLAEREEELRAEAAAAASEAAATLAAVQTKTTADAQEAAHAAATEMTEREEAFRAATAEREEAFRSATAAAEVRAAEALAEALAKQDAELKAAFAREVAEHKRAHAKEIAELLTAINKKGEKKKKGGSAADTGRESGSGAAVKGGPSLVFRGAGLIAKAQATVESWEIANLGRNQIELVHQIHERLENLVAVADDEAARVLERPPPETSDSDRDLSRPKPKDKLRMRAQAHTALEELDSARKQLYSTLYSQDNTLGYHYLRNYPMSPKGAQLLQRTQGAQLMERTPDSVEHEASYGEAPAASDPSIRPAHNKRRSSVAIGGPEA
jgi:hypothetical protein